MKHITIFQWWVFYRLLDEGQPSARTRGKYLRRSREQGEGLS